MVFEMFTRVAYFLYIGAYLAIGLYLALVACVLPFVDARDGEQDDVRDECTL